jgi:hypothetical protein
MGRKTNRHGRNVIRAARRRNRESHLTPEQKRRFEVLEERYNQHLEEFDKEFKRACITLSLVLISTIAGMRSILWIIELLSNG